MFRGLKKLNLQNGTTTLVQIIVVPTCIVIKWIGYITAALLFFGAIIAVIFQFSISQLISSILCIPFSISIWLIARLFGAASIEIERTNNPEIAYNFASFLLAIIAIIISIIDLG